MLRYAIMFGLLVAIPISGIAADDPVQKAMKAYEKHRYEDSARDLRAALPALEQSKQAPARLALGMAYLKQAELHKALAQLSAAVNADYLKRLSSAKGAGRSVYSDLYLGLVLLEEGKADAAQAALERFLAGDGGAKEKAVAKIALGMVTHLRGDKEKAREAWDAVDATDPDIRTEVAAAYSRAGVSDKDPGGVCDEATAESRKGGKQPSIAVVKNCVAVYGRTGAFDKGFDLLRQADLKAASYRESIGKSKTISFYDARLLSGLAAFYLQAGVSTLEKAAADPQLKGIASYYLGEVYALAGRTDEAGKATAQFLSAPQMPPQYKNRAMVRQGALQHQKGKQTEAMGLWGELVQKQPNDPDLLSDILVTCGRLRIECPRIAQTSADAVEKGDGKRFTALNVGLGRYTLSRKDAVKAVSYLEAGRDKGNKNKIESNDPAMLVDLSDAYYRTKKYSEALEIYFEMSKQFPQVRQIQEALQGIYSMEHKSAGDVKIN